MPPGERIPPLSARARPLERADDVLQHLATADLQVLGRIVDASNTTLLAVAVQAGRRLHCVYKPVAGERPLWDFPDGTLARREVAAHAVSAATGWEVVPPTVLREGPYGPGSVQLWVADEEDGDQDPGDEEDGGQEDGDEEDGQERSAAQPVRLPEPGAGLVDVVAPSQVTGRWLPVLSASDERGRPVVLVHADDARLRRIAVLDAVLNNADRKGGHVLRGPDGAVHGVDHGLTFHVEDKLRTVLWGWAGSRLLPEEREVLQRVEADFDDQLGAVLTELLAPEEVAATRHRLQRLLRRDRLPRPGQGWPAIPWPAF